MAVDKEINPCDNKNVASPQIMLGGLHMTTYEALNLMVNFGVLILHIMRYTNKK